MAIEDIKSGTGYTADKVKASPGNAQSASEKYTAKADEAVQTAKQTYQDVKDVVQQNVGGIERQIRDRPVQATLIAAGVGFLVGALLRR
jgi:ElaB/YqjD/DUF883 family membrane-anchored ribosome-binding protein